MFRDENVGFASQPMTADVPVELHVYPHAHHAWDRFAPTSRFTKTFEKTWHAFLIRRLQATSEADNGAHGRSTILTTTAAEQGSVSFRRERFLRTYLLVHGAWHSGRCWDRLVPLLTEAGHKVLTPSLTGHGDTTHLMDPEVGLDTYVDDIVRLFRDPKLADVVLVGHSLAGMIISSVANLESDRVAHLIYLDAMDPIDGQAAVDVVPAAQGMLDEAAASTAPWRIPPMSPAFLGVTRPADIAWLDTILTDESALAFQQPVKLDNPALMDIPATYIRCVAHDPAQHGRQPASSVRPNGRPVQVWELQSGHDCMITAPEGLAELLLKIA